MKSYVLLNGDLKGAEELLVPANNRGFRFGDGLFETMKAVQGKLPLGQFHFERLFHGMKELCFQPPVEFNSAFLTKQVEHLLAENNHMAKARVRLMIFRGNGGLYESDFEKVNYLIESLPLPDDELLNEKGLTIDIYPKAFKSRDSFSNLKTNNFLPYTMAAIYARQHSLHDCLVMNYSKRICDATIANVFLVRENVISTPAITEGCVAGVMRRYLLQQLPRLGYVVNETVISEDQLTVAEEIFLSNAISGIRWVGRCGNLEYKSTAATDIFHQLIKPLFQYNL